MQTRTGSDAQELSNIEAFRMLVLFDNELSREEAISAADLMLGEVSDEVAVQKSMFDTAALDFADSLARAIGEASHADVIILALSNERQFPRIRSWAEQWLKERKSEDGLLAFIPGFELGSNDDFTQYLRETAVSANMDFLSRKPKNRVKSN